MYQALAAIAAFFFYVTYRTRKVPDAKNHWPAFRAKGTAPVNGALLERLQGMYRMATGTEEWGEKAVVKASWSGYEGKKTPYLSLFLGKEGAFMIGKVRTDGDRWLVEGHWRKVFTAKRGTVRLSIPIDSDGNPAGNIRGYWGEENKAPSLPIELEYESPLPDLQGFQIIGHRGGGRNVDYYPVSENTLDMFRLAPVLGATGVEIDVRPSRDGVPVIFHDAFLSLHTIRGTVFIPSLQHYTFQQLREMRLRKDGRIPSLQEALHTIVHDTPLETVWLDMKDASLMEEVVRLQRHYHGVAAALGRNLHIYIGIPDKKIRKAFEALPDHQQIPSLTELEVKDAEVLNTEVWAPQYTAGEERTVIAAWQAKGKQCFVWSLDDPPMIDSYLREDGYDGMVTNVPSVVMYNACCVMQEKQEKVD